LLSNIKATLKWQSEMNTSFNYSRKNFYSTRPWLSMTVGKTFYNIDTSSPQRHSGIVNPVADTYRGCPDISFEAGEKE